MEWLSDFVGGLEAVVNPLSEQQLFLFFLWLLLFTGSSVALVMAERRLTRFFAWLVNSLFSFGMFQAGLVSLAIAVAYWQGTLAVALASAVCTGIFCHRQSRRRRSARKLQA